MRNGIKQGFLSEGYTEQQVNVYFEQAGEVSLTKTHGRSPENYTRFLIATK